MKYSVGDRVKIVSKEFIKGSAKSYAAEKHLESLLPKRIVTIDYVGRDEYFIKENNWTWIEEEIEGLAEEEIIDPISSRFEILDL